MLDVPRAGRVSTNKLSKRQKDGVSLVLHKTIH
jgi:hypothetical protein